MADFEIRGDEVRHGQLLYLDAVTDAVVDSFDDNPLSETMLYQLTDATSALKPLSAKILADQMKNGAGLRFALRLQDNQHCIGFIQLGEISWQARHAELKLMILDEAFWKPDFIQDAIQTLLQFAYWEANLNRIGMLCLEDNALLKEALENSGFAPEGRLRQEAHRNGRYLDILPYSILASEWSK